MTQKKTFILVGILVIILAVGGWWLAGRQDRADQASREKQRYMSLMTTTETLMNNQKYDAAEEQLTDYLKKDEPSQSYERGAYVRLATVYFNKNKYDQAIDYFKKAEAIDGKPKADVAVGIAYAYDGKGDKTNAISYFKEAVKLAEKSSDPMAASDKRSYEFEIKRLEGAE